MADATKVRRTVQQKETVEKVATDAAEGLSIWAMLSLLWRFIEPHAIELTLGLKNRVKKEYNINRGAILRDVILMDPKKRTIFLNRTRKAIDEGRKTHFFSMIDKLPGDEKGSRKDLLEGLADMDEQEFNTTLEGGNDKIAEWIHLIRKDGREMFKRDFAFVATGASALNAAADKAAPALHAVAQSIRERRLGKQRLTGSSPINTASRTGGSQRAKGEWKW